MYPTLSRKILLQYLVDHAMSSYLWSALELCGCDDESEVCLGRGTVGHCLVVFVKVAVVVNFKSRGLKTRSDLNNISLSVQ